MLKGDNGKPDLLDTYFALVFVQKEKLFILMHGRIKRKGKSLLSNIGKKVVLEHLTIFC